MPKFPKKRDGNVSEHGQRVKFGLGKKMEAARAKISRETYYGLDEAASLLKSPEVNFAKFNQTVELTFLLGVDARKSEQAVRGAVVLPAGTGKTIRVLVFAKGEKATEAQQAGADFVGGEELVEKIQTENWLDFDKAIATPDMMRHVGRIGKLLGPRGLMPTPKVGTVTNDVAGAINDLKSGKVEFRTDKTGIVHVPVGKASFTTDQLRQNILAVVDQILRLKPPTSKGVYLRKVSVSLTQSPSVRLDTAALQVTLKSST